MIQGCINDVAACPNRQLVPFSCSCFYLTLIYVFAFNPQPHHPANNASDIFHSDSHLQGLAYYQNAHLHDATTSRRPINPLIQNREVHPRFRFWFQTRKNKRTEIPVSKTTTLISSILKDNSSLIELSQGNEQAISNPRNSSNLLELLTGKPQTRKYLSFVDSYFHQRLRAIFQHQHEKPPEPTRSHIKTGLR